MSVLAQVTLMVKDAGMLVLGIGDGANDVGMIQAANIGIGISGHVSVGGLHITCMHTCITKKPNKPDYSSE